LKVVSLHHVRFAVTDLARTEAFATDFGLKRVSGDQDTLVMRTSGGDSFCYVAERAEARGFRGLAFTVASKSDLEEAVERHGASPLRKLETPGGGWGVTLIDPEGLQIDLVTGVEEVTATASHKPLSLNIPAQRARLHEAQSFREMEPATLFRLGHIGLYVKDLATMADWYCNVLGLLISDTMHTGNPSEQIVGFFRVDAGDKLVDHHTLFLAQFGKTDCHHISFEVQDFEAQFMAHRWLQSRGWEANWGVGRHPLGSHVFDVWFDPDHYRFETFSDTDVVDASKEAVTHDVHHSQMDMWSSDSPERYFA
jgi:catechol 2,3-dioxygenase-like lactoylglutathione lyase family enzyme